MSEANGASPPNTDPSFIPQANPQADSPAPEPQVAVPVDPLLEAQQRIVELQDENLRLLAEMQNIRRRSQEDVSKAHKFAVESFAESLVPVKDSLEMSLMVEAPSVESLREGVNATLNQLKSAFDKNKLAEINPVGEKFDPARHQAISMVPGTSVEPAVAANHVVSVLQKGYLIYDRVLRPALVTVAQS